MPLKDIEVVAYSNEHARSISEQLFEDVPEDVIISQREELLKSGPEEIFSVCALSGSEVVGVCTGARMRWSGSRHRIELVQVAVKSVFRKRGIARKMMKTIAGHFSSRGVEIIQISVESHNLDALSAYERIGFERVGLLQNGIKHNAVYSDEITMACPINTILNVWVE